MREIKFRAWFQVHKKMVYNLGFDYTSFDTEKFNAVWDNDSCDENGLQDATLNYILMQYTGLKDKNGKEIYEGDICSVDNGENIYEIIFYMGGFMVAVLPRKIRIYHISDSLFNNIEVIGNIHENMELVK